MGILPCTGVRADDSRLDLLKQVGIDQHLGAQVPTDLHFRDETGRDVRLGDYFGHRPIILTLVYYDCPMLCTTTLNELTGSLNAMPTTVGQDFDILTISFNPAETSSLAGQKKFQYLRAYRRPGAAEGWHFLTGDETSIRKLTDAVGFRYVADPEFAGQFVHAGGIMVLTPAGKISRYFFGIDYAPKDLRLALAESSDEKIGSLSDTVLLFCFHYDPHTGKYTLAVLNMMKAGGIVTLAALGMFLGLSIRRERAARRIAHPPVHPEGAS
jgi:protein SCO1/2